MNSPTFFTKNVFTAGPYDSLAEVAKLMQQHNVGTIVIVEHKRPIGIVTDRDLAMAVCAQKVSPEEHVQSVMNGPVSTMNQNEDIYTATQYMMEKAVRRLPVVDDIGWLVGLVSLDDLFLLLSREMNNLAEGIRSEVAVK